MATSSVHLQDIRKTYQMGLVTVEALRGINIDIQAAEYVSIMGPSGCGKSTLLNVLGCLDRPTSGRYVLGDHDISQLDDNALSSVRGSRLGFIFQSYNLIQQLTVLENIEVPLYYQGRPEAESRAVAKEVATGPTSCRAASNNGWPLRARWSMTRSSFWPMSRPATSIRPRGLKS